MQARGRIPQKQDNIFSRLEFLQGEALSWPQASSFWGDCSGILTSSHLCLYEAGKRGAQPPRPAGRELCQV